MKKVKLLFLVIIAFLISSLATTSTYYTTSTNFTNKFNSKVNNVSIDFKTSSSDLVYGTNSHISGNNIYLPNINRAGYSFLGYGEINKNVTYYGGRYVSISEINNKSLEAKYSLTNYTIGYILNGGTVSRSNPTTYTIETNTFTLNNPSRTGYTFKGWSGTGIADKSTSVTIPKNSNGNRSYTANFVDDIAPNVKNISISTLRRSTSEECQNTSTYRVAIEVKMLEQGTGFDHYNVSLTAVGDAHGTGFDVSAGAITTNNSDGTITVRAEDTCWVGDITRSVQLKTCDKAGNCTTNTNNYYIGL
ncbi:MAG: InlB B-repeat-containing protein [Bacilli bacterium]|nr:InlB B-repeat-containing protein [Bacilli bacterium]